MKIYFKKINGLFMAGAFLLFGISAKAQIIDAEQMDTTQSTIQKMYNDIESLKRLKISGYIQAQFQYADSSGIPSYAGGDFPRYSDKRFLVRRGRLKATWTNIYSSYVLQVDANESGTITLKDAYFKFSGENIQWFTFTGGVFNRPFGYEITFSSSDRESPERGRMSQIIFPNERDMGFMLTVQAPKTSNWNFIKLDAGFFNGTGVGAKEFDKKKDFISRLSINKASANEKMKYGVGVSLYDGGFRINNDTTYKITTVGDTAKTFTVDMMHAGDYSTRRYYGADAQFSIDWLAGITTIRAEYIMGDQPATFTDTKSPSALLFGSDGKTGVGAYTVKRKFNGAYFYLLQNIGQSKAQLVVKYDWYDPNTDVKGKDIGVSGSKTTNSDIKFSTLGIGAIWHYDQNVKFTAYYDMVTNEKTNLPFYTNDIKDNVLTLRIQYRF